MGFPTPITRLASAGASQSHLATICAIPTALLAAYVNFEFLDDLLDKHYRGAHDATDRIWRLLNLQVWGDMYLTGRREQFWDGLMPVSASAVQIA